ncbi:hypothetical protein SMICM17S_05837 [Streptomyces microflavus]
MIATEPLPARIWDTIGWEGRETLGDMAHAYLYAQRTADDRIAIGGRGYPYRYGSATDNDGRTQPATIEALRDLLVRLFRPRRACASTTPGPASSASPATGAPPSPWTAPRGSAGRAGTSAPASPPPTSPPAPCAT